MYRLSSIFCDFSHYTAENQPYTICCAVKIFCGVYVGMVIWGMKNAGRFHPATDCRKKRLILGYSDFCGSRLRALP